MIYVAAARGPRRIIHRMVRVALRAYATAFRPLYYLLRVAGKLDGRIDLLAEFPNVRSSDSACATVRGNPSSTTPTLG